MIETPILEKKREKNTKTIVAVETTKKEITTDNWKLLSGTAPSCNDCVATFVKEQFTRTGKGVGQRVQPSGRKKERYFPGFQNPEGSRAENSNYSL